ncbi:MAG: potassium channel family protein [Acidimicrobiales bacterium]
MADEDAGGRRTHEDRLAARLPAGAMQEAATADEPVAAVLATLTPTQRRRLLLGAIARILTLTVLLLVVYFVVPLERDTSVSALVLLVLGMIGLTAMLVHQVRRILTSPMPQLRAVESLATTVPLFIVLFSLIYVAMSQSNPASFSEPITRVTGLYFTVTVLATVGFGDVTAVTDSARIVVTIQMILDLVLIGILVKVILGASRIGVQRRRAEATGHATPADG